MALEVESNIFGLSLLYIIGYWAHTLVSVQTVIFTIISYCSNSVRMNLLPACFLPSFLWIWELVFVV